jgi:DNA-binding CsgD family transcriptional regulator
VVIRASSGAAGIFRNHFDEELTMGAKLPDELKGWLRPQCCPTDPDTFFSASGLTYRVKGIQSSLTVRVAGMDRETATMLLEESPSGRPRDTVGLPGQLTAREHEVLRWVSEGKRNSEMAIILGISPRTIEKHVEHVLFKLNVETRAAAANLFLTNGDAHHA